MVDELIPKNHDFESAVVDAAQVRALACEAGFSEAGVVGLPHANQARDAERYETWLKAGRAGTMGYLARANEQGQSVRARAEPPFPSARPPIFSFPTYP